MTDGVDALVLDASALIDLVDTDPHLLALIAQHSAPVIIPSPILAEVSTLDEPGCAALGALVVEPTIEQLHEAAVADGTLSEEDWLCLLIARDRGAVCVTNDGALHRACLERGVTVWRGLRPLIMLVELDVIDARAAIGAVRTIRATNAYVTTAVVRAFAVEIRAAGRRRRGIPPSG
jgi:rRNA-processing protein FCF1